jgi:crotonobetainyl-CoA:carnitine CoA-transferase CaiB-like acyl-CoA transferase
VRVLDLTRLLPGALATLGLAELGAEIVKVEDPNGGEPTRRLPPFVDGLSVYHWLLNRGKKSVALDLRSPGGRAVLSGLVATADVVVESYRPETARRIGVDGATLTARHPRLVHCAITGYGQSGPYAERPGHDLNYVAGAGLLAADRPDPTVLPRMFIADVGGGAMSAVIAMLAALFARERSGRGATLDISMHDAAVYWVMVPAARELVPGGARAVGELPTSGAHASYNVYRTRDGQYIALGALEWKFWRAFVDAIGRPDLAARHATGPADQAALIEDLRALFAERTRDEWLAALAGPDLCVTAVASPAEAFDDPHVLARGVVRPEHGGRVVRAPFVREPPTLSPPPAVGQDTGALLAEIGRRPRE